MFNINNDKNFSDSASTSNKFIIALVHSIEKFKLQDGEELNASVVNYVINHFWNTLKDDVNVDEEIKEVLFDSLSLITENDKKALFIHLSNLDFESKNADFISKMVDLIHNKMNNEINIENIEDSIDLKDTKLIEYKSLKSQVKKIIHSLGLEKQISVQGAISLFDVIVKNNQDQEDASLYTKVFVKSNYIETLKKDLQQNFKTIIGVNDELNQILNIK